MKVAVIFHRFGPYHCARLKAASRCCDISAIELGSETAEYAWTKTHGANGYARVTLFPQSDSHMASAEELDTRLSAALNDCRPEAVAVPGWSDRGAFAALRWCVNNDVPAVLMSESTAHDERRVWWKEFVKRRLVGLCATALVGGRLHAAYLQQLGMRAERIFTGYDVVDNTHFASGNARQLSSTPSPLPVREEEAPFFLASARFIPKKNLSTLLRAYAAYRTAAAESAIRNAQSAIWNLVLLGDGPLRSALNSQLLTLNIQDSVLLPGFKQYDELPAYYSRASAFVHASTTEQWGLVVNEAIAAGLPVIVSNRCGCAPELVRDRVNGLTFDPNNAEELAARLVEMASTPANERERMGSASREIAMQYVPARFGEGLKRAAEMAVASPRKRAGAFDSFLLGRLLRR